MLRTLLRQGRRPPFRPTRDDLRVWIRRGKAPLSIVLIADVSASTAWFLGSVQRILSVLYRDAYRSRDSMGLVAIRDGAVHVLHHPTRNLRAVLGSLGRLSPSGATPLAEALERGLEVVKQQRCRDRHVVPMAVLLSDCHPEPIPPGPGPLMDLPPYRRAVGASRLYGRERVPIIVINPSHARADDGRLGWGTRLGMRLAAHSGGKYYGVPVTRVPAEIDEVHAPRIAEILVEFRDRALEPLVRKV